MLDEVGVWATAAAATAAAARFRSFNGLVTAVFRVGGMEVEM
jgi:hypothetical protein